MMVPDKHFRSKVIFSVLAVMVSIVYIALTFGLRRELGWWAFIDCFALFMASFLELMSVMIGRIIPLSGKTIQELAIAAFILFIVSLIGEYIAYSSL